MTTPEPVSKFNDVKNVVAEYKRRFDAIKSPSDVYRDKRANVKAEIAQVWAYMAAKADPSDMTGVQSIVDLGGHLKELEYMHEATINRNQNAYEEKLKAVVGSLCDDLVIALGPSMVTKSLQKLSKEQPGPVSPDISSTNGPEKPAPVLQESAPPDGQPAAHIDGPPPTPNGPQVDLEDPSKSRKRRRIAENQPGEAEQRNPHPRVAAVQTPIAKATKRTGQANSKFVKDQIPSSTTEPTGVQTRRSRARPGQEDSETVNEPTPGNIYFAFRNKSKEWSAALLLPKTDLEEVGVPGTLDSLGLMDDMPACYSYNKDTDTFRWRKGYRDGQSLVKQRQFPVMFFDGRAFPEKTEVGWVSAKDMRTLDVKVTHSSLIPHHQSVFKYLKERAALAAEEEEEEEEEEDRESMLVDNSGVDSVDEDQGQRAPSIAPTLQGDRDHSPPKESGESATQIPPNTAVLSNPAPSLGDIQKAHPSPKLGPATAMNGQIDMAPEVISISSSPAEGRSPTNQHFPIPDRLRGLPDSHNPQGSSIATERPKGTGEENLYLIQKRGMEETSRQTAPTAMQQTNAPRTRYNAEELMRDSQSVPFEKVQYNAADMMFIPPEMASLARDALDTVYQSESRPEEELPTTVDQQATPPVPGALLATMSVWSNLAQSAPGPLSPESSRSQNGLPANHSTNEQTHGPQYHPSQGPRRPSQISTSSSFTSGLPVPVPSTTGPVSYSPNVQGPSPLNPTPVNLASAGVPATSGTPAEVCRLPPIASSRRQDKEPWSIPSFGWQDPATGSQVENQGVENNPPPIASLQAGVDPTLALADQSPPNFDVPAFSNHPQEIQPPSQPATSGKAAWPDRLPEAMIQQLDAYVQLHNLPPGIRGLCTSEGFYFCPYCPESRRKNYVRVAVFVNHMKNKH